MIFSGSRINPFSARHARDLNALERKVEMLTSLVGALRSTHQEAYRIFPVRITAALTSSSYPIWKYSGVELEILSATGTPSDYGTLSGGETFTENLINDLEQGNDATTAYGLPVTYSGGKWYVDLPDFTAVEVKPVPTGAVVWARMLIRPDDVKRGSFMGPLWALPECEP